MSGIKFSPGSVVATPGALEAIRASGEESLPFLQRHLAGDWGDVDEHDHRENELSLIHGFRLLSAYTLLQGPPRLSCYETWVPNTNGVISVGRAQQAGLTIVKIDVNERPSLAWLWRLERL